MIEIMWRYSRYRSQSRAGLYIGQPKDGLKLNKDAGGARLDPAFTLPKIPSKEERERSKMENKKASEELARDIAVMDYKSKVKYDGER